MPIFNFFSLFFFSTILFDRSFFFSSATVHRLKNDASETFILTFALRIALELNRSSSQTFPLGRIVFFFSLFFFLTRRVWNCTSKSAPRGLDSSLLPSESHSSSINREESTQTLLIVDEERVFFSWFLFDPTDSDIPFDPQNCTSILASHRYSVYDPQNRPRARPIVDTRRELEANQADSIDRQLWARSV